MSATFNKWRTLGVVCLATAMLMLDIAVVNTALPHIARSLHSGLTGVEWVVDAYTLALASVVLSVGSLADRFGRRLIFALGMMLFTASSLACALADSIELLNAARAVQGIGGAMLFASSLAVLADAFPTGQERATATFAFYGGTIGAAFCAIGPLVGGALTNGFGWPAVFYVNLPLGAFALAATFAWLRESRDPKPRRIDLPGQLALSGGLLLLVLALLRGNAQGWGKTPIVAELAGAVVCLAGFVMIELRVREPMLPMGLFRRPAFTGAQVAAFTISASFFALFLYLTLYLQEVLHLSPLDAGLVYLPGTVVMFIVSAATAPLSERISPGILIVAGLFLVAGGLALMLIAQTDSSWVVLLPGELVVCVGTGIVNPALATVAISSLTADQSGLAAGVNDVFRQAGIAVGVAAFGALVPAQAAIGIGSPGAYVTRPASCDPDRHGPRRGRHRRRRKADHDPQLRAAPRDRRRGSRRGARLTHGQRPPLTRGAPLHRARTAPLRRRTLGRQSGAGARPCDDLRHARAAGARGPNGAHGIAGANGTTNAPTTVTGGAGGAGRAGHSGGRGGDGWNGTTGETAGAQGLSATTDPWGESGGAGGHADVNASNPVPVGQGFVGGSWALRSRGRRRGERATPRRRGRRRWRRRRRRTERSDFRAHHCRHPRNARQPQRRRGRFTRKRRRRCQPARPPTTLQ